MTGNIHHKVYHDEAVPQEIRSKKDPTCLVF